MPSEIRIKFRGVESSAIKSVAYSRAMRTLFIEFHSGQVYPYRNIEEKTYKEMLVAPSVGKFFNERILHAHKVTQLPVKHRTAWHDAVDGSVGFPKEGA